MFEGLEIKGARSRAPSRNEVDPAALQLIERYGPSILRTARRYSQSAEDAEDAYQRGLEILLTKAPSTAEEELLPWLKTVIKHEAFGLRRQRERHDLMGDEGLDAASAGTTTDEQAEQRERLQIGAEAMARLKPQEVQCMLLLAEGFSYSEICEETGFSYTKVNRSLTEGRRAFSDRVRDIEAGAECERLAPLLSLLADGEASADDAKVLRRHLRGCPACRMTLGAYRTAPARVAALAAPALVAVDPEAAPAISSGLAHATEWLQERATTLALKIQAGAEMASAQKVAAVTASTAAIAGGGVGAAATFESLGESRTPAAKRVKNESSKQRVATREVTGSAVRSQARKATALRATRRERASARAARERRTSAAEAAPSSAPSPDASPAPARSPSPPTGDSGGEFSSSRVEARRSPSSSTSSPSGTGSNEFSAPVEQPARASSQPGGSDTGGGEFGEP